MSAKYVGLHKRHACVSILRDRLEVTSFIIDAVRDHITGPRLITDHSPHNMIMLPGCAVGCIIQLCVHTMANPPNDVPLKTRPCG